jgi:hypothetical protein
VQQPVDFPPYAEGAGDTFTSQEEFQQTDFLVDWSTLTIIHEVNQDGETHAIVDEDRVFEAIWVLKQ